MTPRPEPAPLDCAWDDPAPCPLHAIAVLVPDAAAGDDRHPGMVPLCAAHLERARRVLDRLHRTYAVTTLATLTTLQEAAKADDQTIEPRRGAAPPATDQPLPWE